MTLFTCTLHKISKMASAAASSSTLQQVHVIFRHGDRTPDKITMYPKDPYLNDTYYPEGIGALTKLGKQQEYNLGKDLRTRYDNFLGNIYTPEVMDAWTTATNRTKMSLQLVLAGLWPPHKSQSWNDDLPWQPIPYNFLPQEQDTMLHLPILYCQKYKEMFMRISKTEEFQEYLQTNADLLKYISEHSGLNCKTYMHLFILYFGLYSEEKNGRILPEWTKKVYPEFLETGAILAYTIQTYNDEMIQIAGGRLLKKIIIDAKNKVEKKLVPPGRKIFLYSAHEYNVVHILAAMKIYKPHIPDYASRVIIELHKDEDVYGFKVFYQDGPNSSLQIMKLPGCEELVPYEKFIEVTKSVMPKDETC